MNDDPHLCEKDNFVEKNSKILNKRRSNFKKYNLTENNNKQLRNSFYTCLNESHNNNQLDILNHEYFVENQKKTKLTPDNLLKNEKCRKLKTQSNVDRFKSKNHIDLSKRCATPINLPKRISIISEDSTDSIPLVSVVELYK